MTFNQAIKKANRLKKQRHDLLDQISVKMQEFSEGKITFHEYSRWMTKTNDLVWKLEQTELRTGMLAIQLGEQKLLFEKNKTP